MYEEFKQFILEQEADRVIDHTGGWSTCVVGDFMAEWDGDYLSPEQAAAMLFTWNNQENKALHIALGDARTGSGMDTYGDVQAFLAKF